MRSDLPTGTVTFLFTDVEGSTKLLHELGSEAYAEALAEHRRVIREACTAEGGVEVDTQGDAFFFAFPTAPGAIAAAEAMTEALASGPIQVRIGLHTGTPLLTQEGYVGEDVHRAARVASSGHGGQVLVSSSTAQLIELELSDLGEHRLKDLSAPERVYQLGDREFPTLKSLYRTNLPVPATAFLGRERELADVVGLLERTRLLTLTGPGGTGKTRLAAQAAGMASDSYPDGVWWIPLASLRDPTLVLETASQVVGAKNGLAEHIGGKSTLLLFDNFEQVVEAAADVASLLASCPKLDLLVTSREPLHVTGEQEYPVPSLAHEEGVELFLARARAVKPDFGTDETVSEICRRLDDLPLALELAGARAKALSSVQILQRLEQRLPLLTGGARDLPERQRTLRATIEWSYELLSGEEQQLFARLSVFAGGCILEAAEEVVEADLDTLQSLVDKSLLRHSNERYSMPETIREYAVEPLEELGEAEEFRRRHAEHFLALGEQAEAHLRRDSAEWLERLEREHDNLRAALDRFEAAGESGRALQLTGALSRFWYQRGHLAEGQRRLERALAAAARPTEARGRALNGAALIALFIGDSATSRLRAEEALELHGTLGDAWGTAYSKFQLGHVAAEQGDFAKAQRLFDESARLFRELDDHHYTLLATSNLAWVLGELGDVERARALHEDTLRRARALHDESMEAESLAGLAEYVVDEGRVEDAVSMLKESYRIYHDLGHASEIALGLCRFAEVLALEGRASTAARLLACAEALTEEFGGRAPWWGATRYERTLVAVRTQLDEAALAEAWEQGRTLTADEAIALALHDETA